MKFLKLFLLLAFIATCSIASEKKYRPLRVFTPKRLRKVKPDRSRLLGPNGQSPFLRYIPSSRPDYLILSSSDNPFGLNSTVRVARRNRPQLVENNFGINHNAPGRVPRKKVKKPETGPPPNPRKSEPRPKALVQLNQKERNQIAQNFFVMANYTPTGLFEPKALIRLMQRNYGLTQTGLLDDITIAHMMAPRCGYPDPPANYQTFQGNPRWEHNPVTYKFSGYSPDLSPCQTRNILKRAFRVWEEVIELDFEEVDNNDADIIIYFGYEEHGDGYPFDGKNGLLAHAFTAGRHALSGDTHFDDAEYWTLGNGQLSETYYGNSDGEPCVFPFIFQNQEYSTCTTAGRDDGLQWCSTTRNFDRDKKFGFCAHEKLFTYGGNANADPCVFPFVFQGKSYDACTYEGRSDGYRWCSTTSNFDQDTRWGFCPDRNHGTFGGNGDGLACVFPFIFNGNSYSECTVVGRDDFRSWCATTDDFDRDGLFGFCQDSGYSLFLVAVHEFGHVIGLDHSNIQSALMYPSYQSSQDAPDFRLPNDDRNGALSLYSPRSSRLRPLQLEKCGGNLQGSDGGVTEPPETDRPQTTPSTTPRMRSTTTATISSSDPFCDGVRIDALFKLGDETFVFKGNRVWRMVDPKGSKSSYLITSQFRGLPRRPIDAAYQRPSDRAIVFFIGSKYYAYDNVRLKEGYPKRLSALNLPNGANIRVDAVFNWERNKKRTKTYFFIGDKYYRYNENTKKMDKNYPKKISSGWIGLPNNLNAAMVDPTTHRQSVFLKGDLIYILHNYKVQVLERIPVAVYFGCTEDRLPPAPILSGRNRSNP